ncbi:DUF599 domain-containing protein [Zoogloea sp.]|uniref:DUF599 domain-containing protein n=1 Tax=Zoogloea sp. TaxID=49181 RepID=UPI001ACC9A75|nr:DUF599 domain-containing protein [Zoogloea sp.]MBN8284758.1 DUF599 domain-containing protein [Zoogloea sp.]
MQGAWLTAFTAVDWLALTWFLACWFGYGWVVEHGPGGSMRGLLGASHWFREEWGRQMLRREVRVADAALIGNLMQNVSFYANTTIYVIAGLLALLGTMDKLIDAASDLPFARHVSREVWEVKLILLLLVFVVAYFKFTWALRQFNMLSILIGAAPLPGEGTEADAERFARINSLAGDEFNRGIRAYYFGLAAVFWFVQPWVFVAVTTLIVLVLYRRDFMSQTYAAMRR